MPGTHLGIVLAGAHQWRARAFERWIPRPLVRIANRRLVDYPLEWLWTSGIHQVQVCANSDTQALRSSLGAGMSGRAIGYYEDQLPRGPAGCVRDAANRHDGDGIVVVDATIIPQGLDVDALMLTHASSGAALTMAVARGMGHGRDGTLLPAGIYVFATRALEYVPATGFQDIKEMLIPRLYEAHEKVAIHLAPAPPRVTDANSCLAANEWVLARETSNETPSAEHERRGEAIVHRTAKIESTARLVGPVLVGRECLIGGNATIVGPSTLGEGCVVGGGATVCRSILWDRSRVGAECVVDRCILAYDSRIPDGTSTSDCIHHSTHRRRARYFGH